jgi:hypothetical protein
MAAEKLTRDCIVVATVYPTVMGAARPAAATTTKETCMRPELGEYYDDERDRGAAVLHGSHMKCA